MCVVLCCMSKLCSRFRVTWRDHEVIEARPLESSNNVHTYIAMVSGHIYMHEVMIIVLLSLVRRVCPVCTCVSTTEVKIFEL